MIRSHTCWHCQISKKLPLNPTLSAKNTPLFLFQYMGTRLKYLPKGWYTHICRLHKTWSDRWIKVVHYNYSVNLLLCAINCILRWAPPQNMAVGDLDFYYTLLYLWFQPFLWGGGEQGSVWDVDTCLITPPFVPLQKGLYTQAIITSISELSRISFHSSRTRMSQMINTSISFFCRQFIKCAVFSTEKDS